MASASFSKTIKIAAPPERIWQIMIDVERWPEWTPSITTIKRLESGAFAVGSRARIKQPKLLPAEWKVTRLDAGHSFTWVSSAPGFRAIGHHAVKAASTGSEVTLVVLFEGIFAGLAARLLRKLNEEYLEMEATGLKRRSEVSAS